ncbi:MAG: cation diffusion facilitator family transporter [Candidatus Pacebacteria bacterium]|nr:cation diffusion facilitator family transporter [Candidatus Paceibacterota bacterium]
MPHRKRETFHVTIVGAVANVLLSAFKITAGAFGNSQAVIADGVHSLSDLGTDIAVLVGAHYWSEPADREHPYGHGRVETIVTLGLAISLAAVGIGIIISAVGSLQKERLGAPSWVALCAAVLSIAVKEILYRWTVYKGKRIKSSAVVANAWHHRTDALSSVPAAIAVGGAMISPAWRFLDPLGGLVVSFFILQAGWRIGVGAIQNLIDHGAPTETVREITELAGEVEGVEDVHGVRTRNVGHGWSVDLHVLVQGDLSVRQGHTIAEETKQHLLEHGPDVADVVVHIEPVEDRREKRR